MSAGVVVGAAVGTLGLLGTVLATKTFGLVGGSLALYFTVGAAISSGAATYKDVRSYLDHQWRPLAKTP